MKTVIFWMLICAGALAVNAQGDAYRWVDDKGNVHFGDRPPDKGTAEDISAEINQLNIDESSSTAKKLLEQHERRKAAIKTEQQQLDSRSGEQDEQQRKACEEARRQLKILRGRVIFYDDDGQEMKVTEKQREIRAASLEQQIAARCN